MNRIRRFGRRKHDRVIWLVAIAGVLALVLTYMQACDDTATTPTVVATPTPLPPPVVVTPQPVTPTPAPSPTATPDTRRIYADCNNATGICTFRTGESGPFKVYGKCTRPGQDAAVHGEWRNASIVDGDTVDARDVCHKIEPYDCKPRQVPVQVDFQATGRHIGHLGPSWTMKLEQRLSPEECEECVEDPKKVYEKECGEWNECHEHPTASHVSASTVENGCFQEKECTITQGIDYQCKEDDIETIIVEEVQPCDCPCIEGGPYEGETIWDPTIFEGPCPLAVTALDHCGPGFGASCVPKCHQNGKQITTWDCQEPSETDTCRPVKCDEPECVIPPAGTTLSWSGPANCGAECSAFGDYECGRPADFWICKAGNDRIVEHTEPDGDLCRNGKERSHTRSCVCVEPE